MPSQAPRPDWRRLVLGSHRWLGIFFGALFVLWFASGIVMLFARMPALHPSERLRRLPPLALERIGVEPQQAAKALSFDPDRLRLGMLLDRPIYRFARGPAWAAVYADDGSPLVGLSQAQAEAVARPWAEASPVRYEKRIAEPDQWTLQSRSLLPAHRLAVDDGRGSRIYVSDRTGEVILQTDTPSRRWAATGAVLHWLYFTPFRARSGLWLQAVTWLSIFGVALTLSGLIHGLRVWSSHRHLPSPYSGLLLWHHRLGLVFGLFSFTWVLSGCLSMEPWSWAPGTAPSMEQRLAVSGGPLRLDLIDLDRLRSKLATDPLGFRPRQLDLVQFSGTPLWLVAAPADDDQPARGFADPTDFLSPLEPLPKHALRADHGGEWLTEPFTDAELSVAARLALPGAELVLLRRLTDYDSYYYARTGALEGGRPLPVVRADFDDAQRSSLYLDPRSGILLHRETGVSRWNRWLYHGLHSFDFPFLNRRPRLRIGLALVLCLGGLTLAATPIRHGWRRLTRLARSGR